MKKYIALFISTIALVFCVSCGDDDDNTDDNTVTFTLQGDDEI